MSDKKRTGYNSLRIKVFIGRSNTLRFDSDDSLEQGNISEINTFFPGGLYGGATIFIPRDVTKPVPAQGGDRIVVENSANLVYEGEVVSTGYQLADGATQGITLLCTGEWGALLGKTTLNKRWVDTQLTNQVWTIDDSSTATALEKARLDRNNRLRITPLAEQWDTDQVFALEYSMPTGETIKRVKLTYDFQEDGVGIASYAKWNDDPGVTNTFTNLTNALDGDTGTSDTITITSDDYLYIGFPSDAFDFIRFNIGPTVNSTVTTLTAEYYKEATDTTAAAFSALTIADGTLSGGATLAQDGDITFTTPDDWARTTIDSNSSFWIRLQPGSNLTAVQVVEIETGDSQNWEFRLRDRTGAANIWSVTSSTASPVNSDVTLGTPRQTLHLELISKATQTPRSDGSYYGQITSVEMYSETGAIQIDEIAKDIITAVTTLNSDDGKIATPSNPLTLVPFVTLKQEPVNSILERSATFGDADFNQWNISLQASTIASSPDGKPVLSVQQYPSLTDFDYSVKIDDPNLVPSFEILINFDNVDNWIVVQYQDIDGRTIVITPDDDSSLKDDTSISTYGQRELVLNVQTASEATAKNVGQRFLADNKDPKFYVSGAITVVGFILGKQGNPIPTSEITAGKRVKVENFLTDLASIPDAGLTFIVTGTRYTDDNEQCAISTGVPDDLSIFLAQLGETL